MKALQTITTNSRYNSEDLITATLQTCESKQTHKAYSSRLRHFFRWIEHNNNPPLTRLLVEAYLTELREDQEKSASARNQALAAIKRLATSCSSHHALDPQIALDISQIKGSTQHGVRLGNWLTKEQCGQMLERDPAAKLNMESRDRAIIALLLGCGLRRDEAATLKWEQLKIRDGRALIGDLIGKGGRVRTVPIPLWADLIINEWSNWVKKEGNVLRSIKENGVINGSLSDSGIWLIIKSRAARLGIKLSPHDLRRTFAKLSRKGGATMESIQGALGHASVQTTEKYVNTAGDLDNPACDKLGIGEN